MIWDIRHRFLTVSGAVFIASLFAFVPKVMGQKAGGQAASTNRLPERTTILTGASARPLFKQHSRRSPAAIAFWTPTPADVQSAEKALRLSAPTFKMQYAPNFLLSFAAKRVRTDYRQYAGFVDKYTGHKCLYVNGFAPSPMLEAIAPVSSKKRFDWERDAEVVFDGGTGYWGAEYDTQTKRWLHFAFNGR